MRKYHKYFRDAVFKSIIVAISASIVLLPYKISWRILPLKYLKKRSHLIFEFSHKLINKGYLNYSVDLVVFTSAVKRLTFKKSICEKKIIITGPARVGKSRVTEIISDELSIPIIRTDEIRFTFGDFLWDYSENAHISRYKLIMRLINRFLELPKPFILEGDLILNSKYPTEYCDNTPLDISHLTKIARMKNVDFFAIGSESVVDKTKGLIKFRNSEYCWTTNKMPEKSIHILAHHIVSRSKEIKELCQSNEINYFKLSFKEHDSSPQDVSDKIINNILMGKVGN